MEQRWASLVVYVGLLAAWSKSLWQSWLCLCIMFVNKLHTVCNSWIASVSTQETINGLCWTVMETGEIISWRVILHWNRVNPILGIVAVFLVPWGYCNQNKIQQDKLTFASFNFSLTLPLNSISLTTWFTVLSPMNLQWTLLPDSSYRNIVFYLIMLRHSKWRKNSVQGLAYSFVNL